MTENKNSNRFSRSSQLWFVMTLVAIVFLTAIGPEEKILGEGVRAVYLHGAWVWTALVLFLVAGVSGLVGLLTKKQKFHCWSSASGHSGILFWVTYLPMSIWAMQANWNGLFLSEPRFRMAMIFAITGILLQFGLALINNPTLTSAANISFIATLFLTLRFTENVMHPPSPMLQSDFSIIQLYFGGLVLLMIVAAWQITRWLYHFETQCV